MGGKVIKNNEGNSLIKTLLFSGCPTRTVMYISSFQTQNNAVRIVK